jgi:hypothetical protein
MAWTESGLFFASWRDSLKNTIALSLLDTANNIALSGISDTPAFAADPATWTTSNEVTGGANWPTGGINLSTGTYAPTLTNVTPGNTMMWDMNNVSIASTTTTSAAYGAYIYAAGLTPKASILAVWFGGTGYSTVAGTFAITWNVAGLLTILMAA